MLIKIATRFRNAANTPELQQIVVVSATRLNILYMLIYYFVYRYPTENKKYFGRVFIMLKIPNAFESLACFIPFHKIRVEGF